jgi:hypothetical protein
MRVGHINKSQTSNYFNLKRSAFSQNILAPNNPWICSLAVHDEIDHRWANPHYQRFGVFNFENRCVKDLDMLDFLDLCGVELALKSG